LDVREPITPAAISELRDRVRVLLGVGDVEVVTCDVGELADPDSVTVDALARLQLTARRLGRSIRLRHARKELQDLLVLTGLCAELPCATGLRLQPSPQAEEREQVGVDEEVDPADPAT
jgi:ABC-type transporter Mla MlaB component